MKRITQNLITGTLAFLMLSIIIVSCDYEEGVGPAEPEVQENENFVSLDEVTAIASVIEYNVALNSKSNVSAKGEETAVKGIKNTTAVSDENGNPYYYIINYKGGGWLIMAGDNRVNPILAFSDSGRFSRKESGHPNGVAQWMANSKAQISYVRENNLVQTEEVAQTWGLCPIQNAISWRPLPGDCDDDGGCKNETIIRGPLLSTIWQQDLSYNTAIPLYAGDLPCPDDQNGGWNDGHYLTGCVATSMAQIMKFYEYPINYNWDAMPDDIGLPETQRLMYDIGVSVDMVWGCNESTASTQTKVASSFKNDFGYSSATYATFNKNIVKNEILANRPVILRAGENVNDSYENGHAWVCDGYSSSYFCSTGNTFLTLHMNWGLLGGDYDGNYAYNDWQFNDWTLNYLQGMVYNIRP